MLAALGVASARRAARPDRARRASACDQPLDLPGRPHRAARCSTELRALAGRNEVRTSRSSAWATTARSPRRSSSATSSRTRPGTRPTRRTSPRSARAGWRRCSTSRRWSPTSPASTWPTPRMLDEATAAAEAMTMARRLSKTHERPLLRPRRHPPADDRRAARPGPSRSASTLRRRRRRRPRPAAASARCSACPARRGAVADLAPAIDAVHDRRRPRRRRHRPARPACC